VPAPKDLPPSSGHAGGPPVPFRDCWLRRSRRELLNSAPDSSSVQRLGALRRERSSRRRPGSSLVASRAELYGTFQLLIQNSEDSASTDNTTALLHGEFHSCSQPPSLEVRDTESEKRMTGASRGKHAVGVVVLRIVKHPFNAEVVIRSIAGSDFGLPATVLWREERDLRLDVWVTHRPTGPYNDLGR
jgi:hypothetical protein